MQGFSEVLARTWEALSKLTTPTDRKHARAQLEHLRKIYRSLDMEEQEALEPLAKLLARRLEEAEHSVREVIAGSSKAPKPEYPEVTDELLALMECRKWRPGQKQAVEAILRGEDVMVIMPTGGGKSLCYQLPALAYKSGIAVVVSPLIALMEDQYQKLLKLGHPVVRFSSMMSDSEYREALAQIHNGKVRLVLAAPERFASHSFRQALSSQRVNFIAIDEAHCISEWGHDFRPDYLRLPQVIKELKRPPLMALTATATPIRILEIADKLQMEDQVHIQSGFDRPNLTFDVISLSGAGAVARKFELLAKGLKRKDMKPAIVYCGSRKDTEAVADYLKGQGLKALAYHAGIDKEIRHKAQVQFMEGKAEVMVATNAFGMGIDKSDIRSVWHWALPTSLEAYYQEAGRAGRDGKPARAILLSMRADLGRLITFNKRRGIEIDQVKLLVDRLYKEINGLAGPFISPPQEESERMALAIAERVGVVEMEPAAGGLLKLEIKSPRLSAKQLKASEEAINFARELGWDSYKAIERFSATHNLCRRKQILNHFGDNEGGKLKVRCCDICESPDWLPASDNPLKPVKAASRKTSSKGAQANNKATAKKAKASVRAKKSGLDSEALIEELKLWRAIRAGQKPAYTVCSNRALEEIALYRPRDESQLAELHGIGPGFIKKHAESLFEVINS